MKPFILLLSFFPLSAFASTQVIPMSLTGSIQNGMCSYEEQLTFKSFPDFDIFMNTDFNRWEKNLNRVHGTIETTASGDFILHVRPESDLATNNVCPKVNLKVLIR